MSDKVNDWEGLLDQKYRCVFSKIINNKYILNIYNPDGTLLLKKDFEYGSFPEPQEIMKQACNYIDTLNQ